MMDLDALLAEGRQKRASDLHLAAGEPPIFRIDGSLLRAKGSPLDAGRLRALTEEILLRAGVGSRDGDIDLSFADASGSRQRANLYWQRGQRAVAVRFLADRVPTVGELGLPEILTSLADLPRGLVLVTGPTGSGKSTTLAAMLGHINETRRLHIVTMEDPIEYLHESKRCIVHQREIGRDCPGFAEALRSALRQDPDVLLVGEMRDRETVAAALTAAETGHLVLSSLHTTGAAKTIDRIVDAFEPHQQPQIRAQLSTVLRAVVSQRLVPKIGGGRVAVHEILTVTDAVANLIRENRVFQIGGLIQTGARLGMVSMDAALAALVRGRAVSLVDGRDACLSAEEFQRYLNAAL